MKRAWCWFWHGLILDRLHLVGIQRKCYYVKCYKCDLIFTRKDWP